MNEQQKLKIIINNLKEGVNLSVFNFVNDKAVLRDECESMFNCDVLFNDNKAFFINIEQKNEDYLTIDDIS